MLQHGARLGGIHVFQVADFVPSLRPVTRVLSSTMAKTAKRLHAFLKSILQVHRQKHNTDESSQDFMDMMLSSQGEDGNYLDDNSIKVLTLVSALPSHSITAIFQISDCQVGLTHSDAYEVTHFPKDTNARIFRNIKFPEPFHRKEIGPTLKAQNSP